MTTRNKWLLAALVVVLALCCCVTSPFWMMPAKDKVQDWKYANATAQAYQPEQPAAQATAQVDSPAVPEATAQVDSPATPGAPAPAAWKAHVKITDESGTVVFDDNILGRTEFHQSFLGDWVCKPFTVTSDRGLKADLDFEGVVNGKEYKFAESILLPEGESTWLIHHQTNCSFALQQQNP